MAGNLPFMTSFSIDGIASHSSRGGGPAREMFPSVESIEEFKVSSANNNAEFMQVTDVTTTSKSGTNQFHGTGFWFINDSALSSVNRFAPKDAAGKAIKPNIQTNSYGVSGGGPIVRNRTFFFGTFEGVREPNEVTLSHIGAARCVPRGRPVQCDHGDPEPIHGPAVCQQPDSCSSQLREDPQLDVRAAEPGHRRRDQPAQLRRQRPRELHPERLRSFVATSTFPIGRRSSSR